MTDIAEKTYITPHRPKGFGVGPFGPLGTGLLVALMFLVILLIPSAGIITSVVVGVVGVGILLALSFKDRYHRSPLDKFATKKAFNLARRSGSTIYRPGTLTGMGSHRLPGVLASSHLHVWEDKNGAEFTILEYPDSELFVINIATDPDGSSLVDQADLDNSVAKFGEWIAGLSHMSTQLVQAAISLESTQDTGPSLTLEMEDNASASASALSKKWANQVLQDYPKGSSTVRAYITLTFKAPAAQLDLDGSKIKGQDNLQAIARLVADRMPSIMESLPDTGAGVVSAMSADEVIEAVRCAYNPQDRVAYDLLASKNQAPPVTLWNSVGPTAAGAMWDHYRHSGGATITWETSGFISENVISSVLMPILEPSADVTVKRVTFLYQPIDPAVAGVMAEHDHRTAQGRQETAKKPTARQGRQVNIADRARMSEASGAALVNFAVLVQATVLDINNLPAARAAIEHQGPVSRLTLRLMHGVQDSAFAQGVGPLGLVTYRHLAIPTSLSQGV